MAVAWRRVAQAAALTGTLFLWALVSPASPAGAHAFLVATEPAQGERLAGAPGTLVLQFSEPPEPSSVGVEMATADGEPVELPDPEAQSLDVRVPLSRLADGVYVVSWTATSAVDGHGSAGEFAFAVGDVDGAVPAASSGSSTSGWGVAASVAFFVGLALAAGALLLRGLVPALPERQWIRVIRAGLLLAVGGAGVGVIALDSGSVWGLVAAIELLAAALLVVGLRRGGWAVPLGFTVAAAGAWSARSHAATDSGILGWLADFVHLAGGSLWAGSLALVVVWGWWLHRRREPWLPLVRRYARLAVVLVGVLGLAGVVSAVQLVPTWRDLWGTGYGRLVVAKAALFGTALAAAALARWWGLARERIGGMRSLMTGEAVAVAAAVLVAALLANGAPPLSAASTEQLLGPPPLSSEVVRDAGLAGQLNVEVASDGRRLDVDVFGPSGPVPGTEVTLALQRPDGSSVDLAPRPCGPGCFTQAFDLADGVSRLRVTASASDWVGGAYEARLRWPPPGRLAPKRLAELVERMRQVPELSLVETTSSGPDAVSKIGPIPLSGDRFIATEPYAGANVEDVRAVGDDRLVLYLPGDQILAVLDLDDAGRLSETRTVARGHEITRQFTYPTDPG
jgi:copper transport protein